MKLKFSQYLLLAFVVALVVSIFIAGTNPISRNIHSGRRINILLIGLDAVESARHTDTLILISYSPKEQIMDLLSIPRDTLVEYKTSKYKRINEIYPYYYKKTKSEEYAINELINTINTEIFNGGLDLKHYIQINYNFFEKMIDLLGKIKIEITEPMRYDDYAGKLHINFSTGVHYLDGKNAMKYIRYRGKGSDIRRIWRQQRFISQWLRSLKRPILLIKSPQLIRYLIRDTRSNIGLWGILNLFIELKEFEFSRIRFITLPGRFSGSYWLCDKEKIENIFEMLKNTQDNITPYLVEIWNASGYQGAARTVRDILIKAGFNVVEWGNWTTLQERTIIKNFTSDVNPGARISALIGCGDIINEFESNRAIDLKVIIGKDFKDFDI